MALSAAMSRDTYSTELLTPDRIEQCYPLALLGWPGLTRDQWQRFCLLQLDVRAAGEAAGGDVLLATDKEGYVRALCVYAFAGLPEAGRKLVVSRIAIAHLTDAICAATHLLSGLQATAKSSGCVSIELVTKVAPEWAGALRRRYDPPIEHSGS